MTHAEHHAAQLRQLMDDPRRARELIEGSCVLGADFTAWESMRRPLAYALDRPGTLLDVGCANGLLLRCLLAWSVHPLVPYGVDVNEDAVRAARALLPEYATHVAALSLAACTPEELTRRGLPTSFDFVTWSVWDDLDFSQDWHAAYLERALALVTPGGRLILAFYDPDARATQSKLAWLTRRLGDPDGQIGPAGQGTRFAWWVKEPQTPRAPSTPRGVTDARRA